MLNTTATLLRSPLEAPLLRARLAEAGFDFHDAPYAFFRAQTVGCTITFYEKGKVVVQGPGAKVWTRFVNGEELEPGEDDAPDPDVPARKELVHDPLERFAEALARHPAGTAQWLGVDETGKGDYFGPLVVVAASVNKKDLPLLAELGVADSKKLTDGKIAALAKDLVHICPNERLVIGPEKYNELYARIRNLNALLGWAHGKAIEALLEKTTGVTWGLSDQFTTSPGLITKHFGPFAKAITWTQWTKAESDPAVAVASILARAEFVRRLDWLKTVAGRTLPKGAGDPVLAAGRQLVATQGPDILRKVAKLHFKTTQDVAPGWIP